MINDPVNSGLQPKPPAGSRSPEVSAVPHLAHAAPLAATNQQPAEEPIAAGSADREQLDQTVKKLNDYVQNMRRTLSFSVEESTGRTVISVYDAETEELIRQIPPEETMQLAELLEGQLKSLMVREKA